MSSLLVHDLDTAWVSSNPAALEVAVDATTFTGAGTASNRLTAGTGATNQFAELLPPGPLDLRPFDELRFWIRSTAPADGTTIRPFLLELSYVDDGDVAGEEHRWFVPVNRAGAWEQRRIGIEADRRGAVRRFRLRCLTDRPFVCNVDELLAVHEELLADVETGLVAQIGVLSNVPGVSNLPLAQAASPGQLQVVLAGAPELDITNRIVIRGGSAGNEVHEVTGVTRASGTTTLSFAAGNAVVGTLPAGAATVSLLVPAIDASGTPPPTPRPAVLLTRLDVREDLERTPYSTQRDSFRPRGALVVCSVRPSARAYWVDYQVAIAAQRRAHHTAILTALLQRLSTDLAARINGSPSPVRVLAAPALEDRVPAQLGLEAALYVRIGTRMETAPRSERPWVQRTAIRGAPIDAPLDPESPTPVQAPPDEEGIVVVL